TRAFAPRPGSADCSRAGSAARGPRSPRRAPSQTGLRPSRNDDVHHAPGLRHPLHTSRVKALTAASSSPHGMVPTLGAPLFPVLGETFAPDSVPGCTVRVAKSNLLGCSFSDGQW